MLRKEITFTDYNGDEQSQVCYFGFNKRELIEMNFSLSGGLQNHMQKLAEEKDVKKILEFIKNFILDAYGEKPADGLGFKKSKELRDAFESSLAFDELYMSFAVADADIKFVDFIQGVIPADLRGRLDELPTTSVAVVK